jgi:hypothetical protein
MPLVSQKNLYFPVGEESWFLPCNGNGFIVVSDREKPGLSGALAEK